MSSRIQPALTACHVPLHHLSCGDGHGPAWGGTDASTARHAPDGCTEAIITGQNASLAFPTIDKDNSCQSPIPHF